MKKDLMEYQEAVNVFSALKEEPAFMLALRQQALAKINELALPQIERAKFHRWPLLAIDEDVLNGQETYSENVASFDQIDNHPMFVQQDSQTIFEQLPQHLIDQGVVFTDLFTALQEMPELVEQYLMTKAVPFDENKLTAAHMAFLNSGMFLYVPKNVVVEEPLKQFFIIMGILKRIFINIY